MNYFSIFSGIGGFEKGIEQAYDSLRNQSKRAKPKEERECAGRAEFYPKSINRPACVGYSEIDKYASAIYRYHYTNHKNYGDATAINVSGLPDFDLLVGGFPCQAFSVAGKRQGFKDTRGTLFFDVARVLKAKKPKCFLLENVKGLCSHDGGKTLATIYGVLAELGYAVGWEVVNSCQFGVPQNRERIFFVGHLTEAGGRVGQVLPVGEPNPANNESRAVETALDSNYFKGIDNHGQRTAIEESNLDQATILRWQNKDSGVVESDHAPSLRASGGTDIRKRPHVAEIKSGTWRTHKDGEGFREVESGLAPTIPARAREDGSGQPVIKQKARGFNDGGEHDVCPPITSNSFQHNNHLIDTQIRRLTPVECERLQGFPDNWTRYGLFSDGSVEEFIHGESVEISDTQRYKCLGNAVTVNVIEAFMRKMLPLIT